MTKIVFIFALAGLLFPLAFCWPKSASDDSTLAAQLASRSLFLLSEDPAKLEISILLAIESMKRAPTPEGDRALRSALALFRKPSITVPHGDTINSIAISSDGRWFGTASDDKTVRITPIGHHEVIPPLNYGRRVERILFSPSGKFAAMVIDDRAALFDLIQKREMPPLGAKGHIVSLAFGAESELLAIATANGAEIFDPITGRLVALFKGEINEAIRWIALDPKAKTIAIAAGKVVHVFDVDTKRALFSPLNHGGVVQMVAFSPVGSSLATASTDNIARLYDSKTGKHLADLHHDGAVNALAFSDNGQLLATAAADGTAHVFFVTAECKELSRFKHQGPVTSIAFVGDKLVVSGSADRTARLFESNTGREVARFASKEPVTSVAANRQSGIVATGSGRTAQTFDIARGPAAIPMLGETSATLAAFSSNEKVVVVREDAVSIHSSMTGTRLAEGPQKDYKVAALAFSPDGHFLAMAKGGTSQIIEVFDGHATTRMAQSDITRNQVSALAFSRDSHVLAMAGYDSSQLLEAPQANVRTFSLFPRVSPDNQLKKKSCPGFPQTVAVSADARFVAIGTTELVCVFGPKPFEDIRHLNEKINAVAFSPDSKWVAVGTERGMVHVFDIPGNEIVSPPIDYGSAVSAVLFAPDSHMLVSQTTGALNLFDVATKNDLGRLPAGNVKAFTFMKNGLLALFADEAGVAVQTYPLVAPKLIEQACSLVKPSLDEGEWRVYVKTAPFRKTC